MTLKDYTDFVVKFAIALRPRLPNAMPALATARREKEQLQALIEELPSLIGPENWEKLTDIFMKKVGLPEGFDKYAYIFNHILWHRDKFTETLAEFCEPLIERTAEKPEGGQDTTKASILEGSTILFPRRRHQNT